MGNEKCASSLSVVYASVMTKIIQALTKVYEASKQSDGAEIQVGAIEGLRAPYDPVEAQEVAGRILASVVESIDRGEDRTLAS